MFQAWAVKMAKIAASSTPNSLVGKRPMKKVTVNVRKPRTGIDWRMSSIGMITSSALRLLAARVATTKVKSREAKIAANMRSVVRRAYSGSLAGSRTIGAVWRLASGRFISCAPWTISTATSPISAKATRS